MGLLLEVPNRGGKAILALANRGRHSIDPTDAADFGDGFLLRQGYTVAWLGWQFDVRDDPGLLRLHTPIARDASGPLRGIVRSDFVVPEKVFDHPLAHVILGRIGGAGWAVDDPESPWNVLTVRDLPLAQRQAIPRSQWRFARDVGGKLVLDDRHVHLDQGFVPGGSTRWCTARETRRWRASDSWRSGTSCRR
jgi:hypothetical protein